MRLYIALLLSLFMVEPGVAGTCGGPTSLTLDMNSLARNANETFRGSQHFTIIVQHVNPLRYDYTWTTVTNYSNTPDLWAQLIAASGSSNPLQPAPEAAAKKPAPAPPPPPKVGAAKAVAPPVSAETATLTEELRLLAGRVDDLKASIDAEFARVAGLRERIVGIQNRVLGLQSDAASATSAVKYAGNRLNALLVNSDSIIQAGQSLRPGIEALQGDARWNLALQQNWPTGAGLDSARTDLRTLSDDLNAEKNRLPSFIVATTRDLTSYRTQLDDLQNRIDKRARVVAGDAKLSRSDGQEIDADAKKAGVNHEYLQSAEVTLASLSGSIDQYTATSVQLSGILDDIKVDGDKYTAFVNAQQSLVNWNVRLNAVKAMQTYQISKDDLTCEYAFSRTKTVKVTLNRTDKMPGGTANANYDLGTMECASPFNVSAGVLLSTLTQREFGIQAVPNSPGSTNTTNRFVTTSDSSLSFQPIALISARLCEMSEKFALGAAFGIGANISSQNSSGSSGSSASFLLGPTVGMFRAVYVTPGLYIGRQTILGGGFKVGDP